MKMTKENEKTKPEKEAEYERELLDIRNNSIIGLNKLAMKIMRNNHPEKDPTFEEWVLEHYQLYFNFISNLMMSFLFTQKEFIEKVKKDEIK